MTTAQAHTYKTSMHSMYDDEGSKMGRREGGGGKRARNMEN
jgi:hypothetical protein